MYLALGALAIALCLAAPATVAALRAWAARLHESRRVTIEQQLPEAFLFIDSNRYALLLAGGVIAVSAVVTVVTRNGLLGGMAGALALLLPAAAARRWRLHRRRALVRQLPDCLELLAASLRSGLALLPAIQHLAQHQPAPMGQELTLVIRRYRLGATLDDALEDLQRRIGGTEAALFMTAVGVARQLGGNLSDVLARLSQTLREKQAIEGKIAALTAQGRLQARIVGLLPLALLAVMMRMEPRAMRLMYTTPQGWAALLVLVVLEISGLLLLRRLVRIDV
ncbi:MAG TPA: type II secretion system F family protein [Burkholderiaceae bacterium]|nr:type II secretion system F family protein [Burkholderiaceae bacterium]